MITIKIGDRVALTRAYLMQVPFNRRHAMASLRGEVLAILGAHATLAVVHWDGVAVHDANHTYNVANICRPRSVAFVE